MLWHEAKSYIPGGNNFLSKRPEMFLPSKWPTYFKKAKGCVVTWETPSTSGNALVVAVTP